MEGFAGTDATYTEGSLSKRFDVWTRRTLDNLVRTQVRSLVRMKRSCPEVSLEVLREVCDLVDHSGGFRWDPTAIEAAREEEIILEQEEVYFNDLRLSRAFWRLSPRRRQVILAIFWEEKSVPDTARDLQVHEQTVENYKCTALKTLRIWMEEDEYGEE